MRRKKTAEDKMGDALIGVYLGLILGVGLIAFIIISHIKAWT